MADPAAQNFDGFGELPMELQIEVWKMTFDAEDPDRMRSEDYPYSYDARYRCYVLFSSPWSLEEVRFHLKRGRGVRVQASVMSVCRISRLVSLQR